MGIGDVSVHSMGKSKVKFHKIASLQEGSMIQLAGIQKKSLPSGYMGSKN